MVKKQSLNEGRVDIKDVELDFEESSEDTEVELILPRKGADERGLPGAEIRDVPEALGTQQDDWSHMGTLIGAQPKWNQAGRPSGVIEKPRGLEAEASGGKAVQDAGDPTGGADPSASYVYHHQGAAIWRNNQLGTVSAGIRRNSAVQRVE